MKQKSSSAARRNRDCGVRRHRQGPPAERPWLASVTRITRVPRSQLTLGRVLWAHVDFADGEGFKIRPVVVVSFTAGVLLVRRCSSSAAAAARWDASPVADAAAAGLPRTCVVTVQVTRIALSDVRSVAGHLSDADLIRAFGAAPVAA